MWGPVFSVPSDSGERVPEDDSQEPISEHGRRAFLGASGLGLAGLAGLAGAGAHAVRLGASTEGCVATANSYVGSGRAVADEGTQNLVADNLTR